MGYGYQPTKATIITNTAAQTGRFVKIMALEDSVIASMTSAAITENGSSTIEGIEFETFFKVTEEDLKKPCQICQTWLGN